MKCDSKKVELSFICERAPATLQPTMHRGTRGSRSVSDYDSKAISRASIEKHYVCDYPSQPPREVIARTTAHRRFVRPGYFWSFGRSDEPQADPGPLQPGM